VAKFDKTRLSPSTRRKVPVELQGQTLWVWEMTIAELSQLVERTMRPAIDPRGGSDPTASLVWQILLSCYDSDAEDAKRVFDEADLPMIFGLRLEEFAGLRTGIAQANGTTKDEVDGLVDFIGARQGA
jgi:hypothetical protein